MDIGVDQRCLGEVDMQVLKQRILAQEPAAWTEQAIRQQTYEVHRDTESIVMLFCDESWPDGEIYRESGGSRLADVAMPVIDHIIATYYEPGGTLLRAMAAKLKGAGPHQRPSRFAALVSHGTPHTRADYEPARRFVTRSPASPINSSREWPTKSITRHKHSVMNMGSEDRISFIFDYVPADELPGCLSAQSMERNA